MSEFAQQRAAATAGPSAHAWAEEFDQHQGPGSSWAAEFAGEAAQSGLAGVLAIWAVSSAVHCVPLPLLLLLLAARDPTACSAARPRPCAHPLLAVCFPNRGVCPCAAACVSLRGAGANAMEATRRLAGVLNADPKMAKSQFAQVCDHVRTGGGGAGSRPPIMSGAVGVVWCACVWRERGGGTRAHAKPTRLLFSIGVFGGRLIKVGRDREPTLPAPTSQRPVPTYDGGCSCP